MAQMHDAAKIVFVVDGVVQGRIIINPEFSMEIAGFSSNPTIVETTNLEEKPTVGWTWDGETFSPPA